MSLSHFIRHYFAPHKDNNFRAKLLHNSAIFFLIGIVLTGNLVFRLLDSTPYHILGFSSSITIDEVVSATNAERLKAGLSPLRYSERLADAARRKAANMFEENYWAHNSPSGKSPWTWFKAAGYSYLYAGENLAKDFGNTDNMVAAWMASPTHKDNIVNPKYQEIGLAVVPGSLQGQDTVLVVQLFGTPSTGSVASSSTTQHNAVANVVSTPAPTTIPVINEVSPTTAPTNNELVPLKPAVDQITTPTLNEFSLKKTLNLATTIMFMLALILDLIIAESNVLSRRVGKNMAHLIFLNIILLATTLVNSGVIN